MGKLDGKVAIITGAAQGMGAAHAKLFVKEGAKVVITDVKEAEGTQLAQELGDAAIFIQHDVSSAADWQKVVDQTKATFGRIDILVNNAGITFAKGLQDISEEDYIKIFKINQLGTFLGVKTVAKEMVAQHAGSIVNISSLNGLVGGAVGYTDTKFAVRGMTKAAALELAPSGVRVNSVHPGVIETPMISQPGTEEAVKQFAKAIPLRRIAKPEEVSKLVLFVASDDASYATGSEFVVDGGMSAQ
ncbi:MAG: glucose 1-dehydrogenase [Levilactobacillus sp.]|jgi:3alpha(or 20beta)-hydroxysteroid dehydrogenase|uniref:Glucose 1-dehydrogenase n=1 Tax=Levilactobacillus suantsaiihabitans TaxID=2487722 RepID=A0A4Z0JCX1_9LACO|nr:MULTISPECIES: glucose 1-dehydrogenase [Levilactobacillus]MCI1553410.1 glucose 1-dehydrogenase [Levilactobacillus sp.]MCI1599055.1 glucose 1-dehydrogenase [Levilactobacillus sp.]MCI1605593.1 glucose 1-dehydrogenase [Levilactobacillus sp.]TGD19752.1 glucose 1-dehydrogenase [Levilactobacillus suantsaiihabitans]